jgi:hypothetical protein
MSEYLPWLVVALVVVAAGAAYFRLSARLQASHHIQAEPDFDNEGFLNWLRDHEIWYQKASFRTHCIFDVARIAPVIIGFAIAVLSALPPPLKAEPFNSLAVIILTGASTVCVSIISQLRVGDLARAREVGRINCAALVARARLFFSMKPSEEDAYKEKLAIKDQLFKLEHDQAALFAAAASVEPRPTVDPKSGEGTRRRR